MTKALIIAIALIAALGYAGNQDHKDYLVEQASAKCQQANLSSSTTPTLSQCIDNQLERNNDR